MGDREEACVERWGERREGAGVGWEVRALLQEDLETSVGKGLGANWRPRARAWARMGLKPSTQSRIDTNEPASEYLSHE